MFGYTLNYELLTVILGLVTAGLTLFSLKANARKDQLEAKFEDIKEYGKNTQIIDYVYLDLVLLGPRDSGKTSVTKLWTKAWSDIRFLSPTEEWETCEISIFDMGKSEFFDGLFETTRVKTTELRLRIHDYPGEDRFRLQALEKIPQLERPVLLLFFDVQANSSDVIDITTNNNYYSRVFMDAIERSSEVYRRVGKVIIVFNKQDSLPQAWSEGEALAALRRINRDAIGRIESLFSGKLETFLVSALKNTHLISLLGSASSAALEGDVRKKFEEEMKTLYEKRAVR